MSKLKGHYHDDSFCFFIRTSQFPLGYDCLINNFLYPTGKHGGYNKFEVTPPPQQQQDYDERKQQNDQRGADQGGYGPRKQVCFPIHFNLRYT